jgi:hypothetical protein
MSGNSWEVDSYKKGKWRISVRQNPENDRVDEGDFPDGHFSAQKVPNTNNEMRFNVFMDNFLVAEVQGIDEETRTIIPMKELSEKEEEELYRFLDENL